MRRSVKFFSPADLKLFDFRNIPSYDQTLFCILPMGANVFVVWVEYLAENRRIAEVRPELVRDRVQGEERSPV